MDELAAMAVRDAAKPSDALDAECWASALLATWGSGPLPDDDAEEIFLPSFVRALERRGSDGALAVLRASSAVGGEAHRRRALAAADRLSARGLREPEWAAHVGAAEAITAELMYEQAFDDGVTVLIEFTQPGCEQHTLGIYIDHNLGGLVKDVFVAGPLSEVHRELERPAPNGVWLATRELGLDEARARVEAALFELDHTYDPPVEDDVHAMRALVDARIGRLPEGFELPDDDGEISDEERRHLRGEFLDSPEGRRWRGDEHAEDVIGTAINFGAGYNHGGPLRWSPVVVEIFMVSWLPRKVVRDPAFFERVAEVLPDWVRYAGGRSGVPDELLAEAVGAVEAFRAEMLERVSDPEAWGPAKALALAAEAAGVDLADRDAVNAFIEQYNQ
jgi:hypothetical protein